MRTQLDKRFFGSSRGRIVSLLRGGTKTVNELSRELGLTDNAVRAHLLSLERDGLIRQRGLQRGARKPHFAYELTEEAENLFPKAYDVLLNQLIKVLKTRLAPRALKEILREVGSNLVTGQRTPAPKGTLESRVDRAVVALEAMGGAAHKETEGKTFSIKSQRCPLAAAVTEHPEVCQLVECMLSEIVGTTVREHCEREGTPRCLFQVGDK